MCRILAHPTSIPSLCDRIGFSFRAPQTKIIFCSTYAQKIHLRGKHRRRFTHMVWLLNNTWSHTQNLLEFLDILFSSLTQPDLRGPHTKEKVGVAARDYLFGAHERLKSACVSNGKHYYQDWTGVWTGILIQQCSPTCASRFLKTL